MSDDKPDPGTEPASAEPASASPASAPGAEPAPASPSSAPGAEPVPFDLTPVDTAAASTSAAATPARRKRKLISWALVLVAFAGIGYLLYRTLDDASLFFLSVEKAEAQREDLGDRRFQLHGTPVPETIQVFTSNQQTFVRFSLAGNDSAVEVMHVGAPPDLFQPCVPVVLRGRWEDAPLSSNSPKDYHFSSTQILVKHDNDYTLPEVGDEAGAEDYGADGSYGDTQTIPTTQRARTAENHQDETLARLVGCPNV